MEEKQNVYLEALRLARQSEPADQYNTELAGKISSVFREAELKALALLHAERQSLQTPRATETSAICPEAEKRRAELQLIMAKENLTIKDAHILLGCSDGHIRNLVEKARKGKASNPIPCLDLDGVTVFPRARLLEWAAQPKKRLRAVS